MCYYRLYLFVGCGHSTISDRPVKRCKRARDAYNQKHPHDSPQEPRSPAQREERGDEDEAGREPRYEQLRTSSEDSGRIQAGHETVSEASERNQARYSSTASSERRPRSIFTDTESWVSDECDDQLMHPFQSYRIDKSCPRCEGRRVARLAKVETGNEVRFEDWRWKVKYLSPVPEEARYTEWGTNWGEAMGSWVNDVKGKGVELGMGIMSALGEFEDGGESSTAGSSRRSVSGRGRDEEGSKWKSRSSVSSSLAS